MPHESFANGRERAANYIEICHTIVDPYPLGPVHGFQKDAIQNAVDAHRSKKGCVQVAFEYIENLAGRFLTVTDTGTTGLTGPYVRVEDYEEDLPEDFHWARFEGFAFTKRDPEALGARGQGKFVLMRASEEYLMYYDTLREDGIYRLGGTKAQRTGCPILPADPFNNAWEGDTAAAEITDRCGLRPLADIGTRVIIASPRREYVDALRSGEMADQVRETWFRAIEKKKLIVRFTLDGSSVTIEPSWPFPIPVSDNGSVKTWVLGKDFHDDTISVRGDGEFRVKHMVIARMDRPLPEDLQGVAVLQSSMKIEPIPMMGAPTEIRECITGYVEFDGEMDEELRKTANQKPNHYELHWRRKVPRAIRAYVDEQMQAFGEAKLGLGGDPRQERQRRRSTAAELALREIAKFAQDLDLFSGRGTTPPPPGPGPTMAKDIGVSMPGFVYPDSDIAPRVERGGSIDGLSLLAYNKNKPSVDVFVAARILHGDSVVKTLLEPTMVTLNEGASFEWPAGFAVDDEFAEAGQYRVRATMDHADSGERIDAVARHFWVDAEPPFRAPFEVQAAPSLPDRRQWLVNGSIGNSPTVFYSTTHPAYELAEDEDQLLDYLREIFLGAAVELILDRPDSEDGAPDFHPLEAGAMLPTDGSGDVAGVPLRAYKEITRYLADLRWRVLEG